MSHREWLIIIYSLVKIADAVEYVNWVDLIVPIGGDGTFLLTFKLVTNNVKPMIGINPNQEEYGNLTLPYKYSSDIATIFEMLLGGEYTILMRSLIRTSMHGEEDYIIDPFTYTRKAAFKLKDEWSLY